MAPILFACFDGYADNNNNINCTKIKRTPAQVTTVGLFACFIIIVILCGSQFFVNTHTIARSRTPTHPSGRPQHTRPRTRDEGKEEVDETEEGKTKWRRIKRNAAAKSQPNPSIAITRIIPGSGALPFWASA